MTEHIMESDLNDYVEDLLGVEEGRVVGEHLAVCASCRAEEAALRGVREELWRLPKRAHLERDLWPAIAERTTRGAAERRPVQLLAASLILGILAAGVWLLFQFAPAGEGVQVREGGVRPEIDAADFQFESAVADLERVIEEGRDSLDPALVQTVNDSLRAVDAALAEERQALRRYPSAEFLVRQIDDNRRRKLELLRQVASMVQTPV